MKLSGTSKRRHIPTLDGWRALAILLVLWAHQGNVFYATPEAYLRGGLFYFGTWGVPVFFGLSGLLITKLLLEEQDRAGRIDLPAFYLRRCRRILPPLFVYLAVVAALGLAQSGNELWSCVLFFRNYLPWRQGGWYTGHLWSLSVEEQFYLFWPALLVWAGVRRGAVAALGLSVLSAAWRWWNLFPGGSERTDLRLDSLLFGAVLAFALHSERGREVLRRGLTPAGWAGCSAALLVSIHFGSLAGASATIPLLIAGTVLHPEWWLSRVLEARPVRGLGRISYSLYLWQQLFLYPPWQPKPWGGVLQTFPVSLAAAFGCALVSYFVVEQGFWSKKKGQADTPVPVVAETIAISKVQR